MSFGSNRRTAPLRRATVAGPGLLVMLLAVPALASAAPGLVTPALLATGYVSKVPPQIGSPPDSDKVYMANMQVPRTRTGAITFYGGAFTRTSYAAAANANLGARIGINVGNPLVIGIESGWIYHTKSLYDTSTTPIPPAFEPKVVLATATANLIPVMAFLQATLNDKRMLAPYVGIGAGYEWLILTAKDYRSGGTSKSLTYGNWAWDWYGGVGLKLSQGLRLNGEVFYNIGTLGRDVYVGNDLLRETVDVQGAGARIGLNIIY
jgi:hypothetical protein